MPMSLSQPYPYCMKSFNQMGFLQIENFAPKPGKTGSVCNVFPKIADVKMWTKTKVSRHDMLQKSDLATDFFCNQPEPPKAVSGSTQKRCLLQNIAAYSYGHWTYAEGSRKNMWSVHCQFEKTLSRSSECMKLLIRDICVFLLSGFV